MGWEFSITDLNIVPTQPKLVLQDSLIYVVDSREEKLVSISQFGQTQTVSTDHHFSRGSLLTTSDNGLLLVSRGKVMPVGQTGQLGQPEQLADTVQPVAIAGFGQNGYVLEAAGQIYRLPNMVDSIGQTSRYFINPISGEDLVDIAVDGSIYLLRGNGSVELYLNGLKQQLTLERASLIHDAQAIFASPELPNIYILQKNAMLAWSKNGKYLGQYQLPQAQEWQMATIDAENKSIYILSNNQLLKANLP